MLIKTLSPFFGLLLLALCFTSCDPETKGVTTLEETEFDAANSFSLEGVEYGLNHAYTNSVDIESEGTTYHNITLTTSDVASNGRLTGISDMIAMSLITGSATLEEGSYQIGFGGTNSENNLNSYYCQNMNFTTFSADDDVPTSEGTLTVSQEGDRYVLAMDFGMADGRSLVGTYTGELKAIQ